MRLPQGGVDGLLPRLESTAGERQVSGVSHEDERPADEDGGRLAVSLEEGDENGGTGADVQLAGRGDDSLEAADGTLQRDGPALVDRQGRPGRQAAGGGRQRSWDELAEPPATAGGLSVSRLGVYLGAYVGIRLGVRSRFGVS